MGAGVTRRVALLGLAAAGVGALSGCKIVAIADNDAAKAGGFNAAAFAEELWSSRALPHVEASAKPIVEVLAAVAQDLDTAGEAHGYRPATEGSPWTFIVTGTGVVTAKNTQSRAGTLTIAVDGTTPPAEVALQIGPVVRGNAVRDSLPFVSFKDFTNQLEYADVGKALTALALAGVAADAEAVAEGARVNFTGAMSLNRASDKLVVTPIALKVDQ